MIFGGIQQFSDLTAKIQGYVVAVKGMSVAEQMAAVSAKALRTALLALGETAVMLVISLAIQGLAKFADKLIVTKSELSEFRSEVASTAEALRDGYEQFSEESKSIEELVGQYKEIAQSASGMTEKKDELLKIQTDLIDKYGEEAKGLDLVNGKYDETIQKIEALSEARRLQWERENADKITQAQRIAEYNVGWTTKNANGLYENIGDYDQYFFKGSIENADKLAASLFKIKGVSEDLEDVYKEIDGIDFIDGITSNDLLLSGTVEEARDQLGELIDRYSELAREGKVNSDGLKELSSHFETLNHILDDTDTYLQKISHANISSLVGETFNSLTELDNINASLADSRDKWFENASDKTAQLNKSVESIQKAMQTIAGGEGLSSADFWGIKQLDTDNILQRIRQVGDTYILDQEQLITLKDKFIQQQIDSIKAENDNLKIKRDELKTTIEQAEVEMSILGSRGGADSAHRRWIEDARQSIIKSKKNLEDYGDQIRWNNMLIEEWNGKLGDTVDKTQLIKDLQAKADAAEKAMLKAIDDNIKKHNDEKSVLENQKSLLEEQLKVLEDQQKQIESIIDDYKSVANIVKDEIEKSVKQLEEQQKAQEDAVQARIDALKETKEQQEKENALVEKELALKQKLADLEKAKNTKVRTYSTERGYHYDVDKQAVMDAESAVSDAQEAYDKALAEDVYNAQLEALEKEKSLITKNFEEQIKALEDYSDQWTEAIEEQTKAEDERLAQQILGSNWRVKINKIDTGILNNFKTSFKQYNTQLTTLVNNEIAQLKNSIKAKEDEIKAKQNQIKTWEDYRTTVSNAIDAVKNKYSEYETTLANVSLSENSSYNDREAALRTFVETYEGLVDEIVRTQGEIQDVHAGIYVDTNFSQVRDEMAVFIDSYRSAIEAMQKSLEESLTGYGVVNSEWDAKLAKAANALRGYSGGGVIDYTGAAIVHGSKSSSEIAFNASQARELYDMVKSGNFTNQVANKAYEGLTSVLRGLKSGGTDNSSTVINLRQEFHGVQNGREFANQFNANIEQYWRTKLTESLVR